MNPSPDTHTPNQSSAQTKRKRFQACIPCRTNKIRCIPSTSPGTCSPCLKSSRQCIKPGPAKPRIKSAQKFSELEEKIEVLTRALAGNADVDGRDRSAGAEGMVDGNGDGEEREGAGSVTILFPASSDMLRNENEKETTTIKNQGPTSQGDVIDDSIISHENATSLFNHWTSHMSQYIPFFQLNLDMTQLRTTRPILFLTILTIASSSIMPEKSTALVCRLTEELGRQIFVLNKQNIDIVEATVLFSQYFFETGVSTNIAPSKYIYAAAAMATDLGLGARAKTMLTRPSGLGVEAASVCLSMWFATSIAATQLHRNPLIRHSPEFESYAKALQSDLQISNRWGYSLLKLQQILESASLLIDTSEDKSEKVFDDPSTQYKLNMLQKQIKAWDSEQVNLGVDDRLKQHALSTAYLQIHEIAVRCFIRKLTKDKQDKHQTSSSDSLMGLTPVHFDCLTKCIEAIKTIFDLYLSFDLSLARCLPNSYLYWNMTTAVILIKLGHFGEVITSFEGPNSTQGTSGIHADFKTLTVHYLDAVAERLVEVCQDGHMPQAKPYVTVMRKLKPYYLQKRSICINPHNDELVEDPNEETNLNGQTGNSANRLSSRDANPGIKDHQMVPPSRAVGTQYGQHSPEQLQMSGENMAQNMWTPSSDSLAQRLLPTPASSTSFNNQPDSPMMSMDAAYDPLTYANTDWMNFTLDQYAIEQIDSFMFAEEDTAWMQSLL